MGFSGSGSQSGVQSYTQSTPQAAFNWQDLLDHLGSTPEVGASPYGDMYKQLAAHAQNQVSGIDSLQQQLKSMMGNGLTLANRQQTDQAGQANQDLMQKAVAGIKENPLASGTQAGGDLVSQMLTPGMTSLYGQQSANQNTANQTSLGAANQLQGIPGMTNQLMAPSNAQNQNYWTQQGMNTQISQGNIQNQLNQGNQYGQLAQLISGLTSNYMLPNQEQQAGQGALGGLASSIGPILGAIISSMLGGSKGGGSTGGGNN